MAYNRNGLAVLYTAETDTEILRFFTQRSEAERYSKQHTGVSASKVKIPLDSKDERVFREAIKTVYSTRKSYVVNMDNYRMRHIMCTMMNQHMY